jgi:hypothetical protein
MISILAQQAAVNLTHQISQPQPHIHYNLCNLPAMPKYDNIFNQDQ